MQGFIIWSIINPALYSGKTKGKCLSEQQELASSLHTSDYYFSCFHYIHQNPLKAALVSKLEDWNFSSFKEYAGLRNGTLINKSLAEQYCSYKRETFLKESYEIIDDAFWLE